MELNDVELRRLSDNLGLEWQKLGTFLGFKRAKIQQFELNHVDDDSVENTIFDMLVTWREQQPSKTNFRKLMKSALGKCGRVDLAESISPASARDKLDEVYTILKNKLETEPDHFQDAIIAFHHGIVSRSSDVQLAVALTDFGKNSEAISVKPETPDVTQALAAPDFKWVMTKSIEARNETDGPFESVFGVALHRGGSVAVVEGGEKGGVFAFNERGQPKFGFVQYTTGVAVTQDEEYLVTDGSTDVKVYDSKGVYQREFSTLARSAGTRKASARCITVAHGNGNVLVGDYRRELVTVHRRGDLSLLKEVYIDRVQTHIAGNQQQLWVSSWEDQKVVAFNYSGDAMLTIYPTLSGNPAHPTGMVCTSYGSVLVAVSKVECERRTRHRKPGSGHVHEYDCRDGAFMRCVIKGLHWPGEMAMQNDVFAIADDIEVKIYTPEAETVLENILT